MHGCRYNSLFLLNSCHVRYGTIHLVSGAESQKHWCTEDSIEPIPLYKCVVISRVCVCVTSACVFVCVCVFGTLCH